MRREAHVRFWEGVGVQFPCATRLSQGYEDVPEARAGIGGYVKFYNERRPHTALDRQTLYLELRNFCADNRSHR